MYRFAGLLFSWSPDEKTTYAVHVRFAPRARNPHARYSRLSEFLNAAATSSTLRHQREHEEGQQRHETGLLANLCSGYVPFRARKKKRRQRRKNNFDSIRKWKESLCAGIARKELLSKSQETISETMLPETKAPVKWERGETNRVIQAERVKFGLMNVVGRILPVKKF